MTIKSDTTSQGQPELTTSSAFKLLADRFPGCTTPTCSGSFYNIQFKFIFLSQFPYFFIAILLLFLFYNQSWQAEPCFVNHFNMVHLRGEDQMKFSAFKSFHLKLHFGSCLFFTDHWRGRGRKQMRKGMSRQVFNLHIGAGGEDKQSS